MSDALTALEVLNQETTSLAGLVEGGRGKFVDPEKARLTVRRIVSTYTTIRAELEDSQSRAGIVDRVDVLLTALLQLAAAWHTKNAYAAPFDELRVLFKQLMVDTIKAQGRPRLFASDVERGIHATLLKMLPTTAVSYEQVLRDIAGSRRVSWRGPGMELREILREVIHHLAPDDKVIAEEGFKYEKGLTRPTHKQKVKFILRARKSGGNAVATAEGSLDTFEEKFATLARSAYDRGSAATHTPTDAAEVRKLKGYVDAVLGELLEIETPNAS